jgi:hypothetical protein
VDFLTPGEYRIVTQDQEGDGYQTYVSDPFDVAELAGIDLGTITLTRPAVHDYDGAYPDLLARDKSNRLILYTGNGGGGFGAVKTVGSTMWKKYTAVVQAGDMNGDGNADVVARQSNGYIYLWKGNGKGGWLGSVRISITSAWKSQNVILSPGDFDGDGIADLISRNTSGYVYLWRGTGTGTVRSAVRIATGWKSWSIVSSAGDFDGDGNPDLVTRDKSGGLYLYPGNGIGGFKARVKLATGWQRYNAIVSVGDFDLDGHSDLMARESSGYLYLIPGDGAGGFLPRTRIGGTGFKTAKLAS